MTESSRSAPEDSETTSVDEVLRDALLERARGPFEDVGAFLAAQAKGRSASTVAQAAAAGARANRLGYAFVGGYFAALDAVGGRSKGRLTSLAATEIGGVHPRAIEATIADRPGIGLSLRGEKTFVTLAPCAQDLLVIARHDDGGPQGGRRRLVAVRIAADRDGVRIETRPATDFAPEVPHARVFFEDVAIDPSEILPGHGWDDWLKPFRTVEDVHVLAAAVGHFLAVARAAGAVALAAADLAAVVATTLTIEREGWSGAGSHLALEGAFSLARGAFTRVLGAMPEEMDREKRRLERDLVLLAVAEGARAKRLEVALTRVTAPSDA